MNAGILLMIAYWVIFTVRKHFTPKLAAATKANTYSGPPVQETPGEGIIGIKTNFTPAEKMKSNQFTFAFNSGKDGENT